VQSFTARMPLLAATNQRIRIREQTLEFSPTVLSTLSLHLIVTVMSGLELFSLTFGGTFVSCVAMLI